MSARIVPYLWFDRQAEEAASFYVSLFPNSRITHRAHYPEDNPFPGQAGTLMLVEYELDGQAFAALNGGPHYRLSPAMSLLVNCDSQAELDRLFERLTEGGEVQPCGWLADRFGLSWQLVPRKLLELMRNSPPDVLSRIYASLMQMQKLDLATLETAARQGS